MLKAKQKTVSLVVACLTMLLTVLFAFAMLFAPTPMETASAAEATTVEMSIRGTTGTLASDKSSISWTSGNVTFTNKKGSTAIRNSDSAHYRVYANSTVVVTASDNITEIVITCTSGSYANVWTGSLQTDGYTLSVNSSTVTVKANSSETAATEVNLKPSAQTRISSVAVTYEEAAACAHEANESWSFDAATNEHYKTCAKCSEEMADTRTACSDFSYGEYNTVDGTHTRTATCTVCNGAQTESGTCEINAEYTRDGDTHTQTGTCAICGDTTTLTENCTLTYSNVSNDDKTHTMTSSCSVCNIDVVTENVACTFESEAEGLTLTYTCKYCGYVYNEEVEGYTITYVVPNGVTAVPAVEIAQGYAVELPTAETIEGYSFVGWMEKTLPEKTEVAPSYLAARSLYTATEDVTLYALYTYKEGTGAYTKVTDASTLAVGKQIVIVASASDYALGSNQASNNRTAVAVTKSNDTVTWTTAVQVITLEAGAAEDTWAFHVTGGTGTNADNGYLYAASSGNNYLRTETTLSANSSWSITINASGVATIKAQGSNTRNLLKKNSSSALFSCYESGQNDVSIYMKNGATYYVTEFNSCEHENVNEVIEEATCTESGSRTVTCLDCESIIEAEVLPALGHNFVDGSCENCGNQDPSSIVYDGYYYLSVNGKYAGEKDSKYYKLFDALPEGNVDLNYVFYFVKNGETYDMYNVKAGLFSETVTIETQENYSVHILNSEGNILSHNTVYTTYQRLGFYKTSNSYPADIMLTPVELNANTENASITVGADLTLNYYVTMDEVLAEDAKMYIAIGENEEEEIAYTIDGGRYKFSLEVPPQCMTDVITATLKSNGLVLDTVEYSIQTYAQNMLNKAESSTELKQLLTDMLYYGAAAQNYKDYNTGKLATDGVENLLAKSDVVAPEANATPVKNTEIDSYPAYFKGATVFFNDVNQIFVYINTTENVTLTINGVEVELDGTTIKTEGILATEFDKEFVFRLYYDGVLMQTLTYSVNAYAYKTQSNTKADANMKALATALYRYGAAAKAYNA